MRLTLLVPCLLACALATPLRATAPAAAAPALDAKQRARFDRLRPLALDADPATALAALKEMSEMGPGAHKSLADLCRNVLTRDKTAIERAAAGMPAASKLKAAEEQLAQLRKAARDNIDALEKGEPVRVAHANHDRLLAMLRELNPLYAQRTAVADAWARRPAFLTAFREAAPKDPAFADAAEAKLAQATEKGVGLSATALAEVPGPGGKEPAGPIESSIWFYRSCRQIEAYNGAVAPAFMGAGERDNLRAVNDYRTCLGILPLEADPRLAQAARRHCKEMIDLNFFAHVSPTAANKEFTDRCRHAGYDQGSGENIAYGVSTGMAVFQMWFDSPGHHKNMAGKGHSAIGVGRWNSHWTQNFGHGPRLMLATPEERAKVTIKGEVLRAQ